MKRRIIAALGLALLLTVVAPAAKADPIEYTFQGITVTARGTVNWTWSFETPSILMSSTTISSFLSTDASGVQLGCMITSAVISPTASPFVSVRTNFDPAVCGGLTLAEQAVTWSGEFTVLGTYTHPSGSQLTIGSVPAAVVPEPATLTLLVSGLLGVGIVRRRFLRDSQG